MSICISSKEGVKARKGYRCCLCGEGISTGELHDTRTGVQSEDGFWVMRMHSECHRFEQSPENPVDPDWYEDIADPAFERADAHKYATKETTP